MRENLQIIRDPNKVALLVEHSRWEIWNLLREGRLTADAIAEKVDKNVSTIYRHLKKLIEAGYTPHIAITDRKTRRGFRNPITICGAVELHAANPPGMITQEAWMVIQKAINKQKCLLAQKHGSKNSAPQKLPVSF